MKRILILGDSWGVPDYCGIQGSAAKHHTENLLRDLGYNVINCSAGGGSNIDSINRAFQYKADAIVWFHTELTRDIDLVVPTNLNDTIEQLSHLTYKRIAELKTANNAKVIAIGACATLHPNLFDYMEPDFYINDWVNDICSTNLPPFYSSHKVTPKVYKGMTMQKLSYYITDSKEILLEHYQNELNRLVCISRSKHFPDGGHPGITPHVDLVNTIKNTLP